MTRRDARRKLGSRTNRRRSTNGKNIPGSLRSAQKGKNPRMAQFRNPRPASRKVALGVRDLLAAQARILEALDRSVPHAR